MANGKHGRQENVCPVLRINRILYQEVANAACNARYGLVFQGEALEEFYSCESLWDTFLPE